MTDYSRFISKPTQEQLEVIKAIEKLMESAPNTVEGLTEARQAIAAALHAHILEEYQLRTSASQSKGSPDPMRLLGKRSSGLPSQPPGADHLDVFVQEKKAIAFTSQPYGISYETLEALVNYCKSQGFRADVCAESWHYPGRTVLIEFRLNEDKPKI